MKTTKALLFIYILGFGSLSLAQESQNTATDQELQFYERLAQRDAAYEQELHFANEQDERDYWNDQKNFEDMLLLKHPKAYQVYISSKGSSYIEHIQICQHAIGHGDFYKREVALFLLETSAKPLNELSLSQTNPRKASGKFR